MMTFIGQVKQSIAKAIQKASDNTVYTELPECSTLCNADRLSIKVVDSLDIAKAREKFLNKGETYFRTKFVVRNEKLHKNTILSAELISGRGFVVKAIDGTGIMNVKLSPTTSSSFGKIAHPSQATIYKVMENTNSHFEVYKTGGEAPVIVVQKVFVSLYPVAKLLGLLESECVYWFKSADNAVLGYIRPKIVLNGKTVVIKFTNSHMDSSLRTAIVGVALLLILHDVYPELKEILQAGIHHASTTS